MRWLAPARRRGVEILDDPSTPSDVREQAMVGVASANSLFGGISSVLEGLRGVLPELGRHATLLDVGTGLADIPARAQQLARVAGVQLTTLGIDVSESLLRAARHRLHGAAVADALRLPIADASVDVVTCSQLLHHFEEDDARQVIAELDRVARGWVVLSDLRRSWFAAAGFWTASILFGFHPVTRHDGVTSVLRGFTAAELEALVVETTGVRPHVRHGVFWRLSATWHTSV